MQFGGYEIEDDGLSRQRISCLVTTPQQPSIRRTQYWYHLLFEVHTPKLGRCSRLTLLKFYSTTSVGYDEDSAVMIRVDNIPPFQFVPLKGKLAATTQEENKTEPT